ncbi:class I glutamine amidotransferase-like protein [Thozetella sp. PMI_491]|nr:class I glutamine amidotransferase-like protein [Thozetella sp. PMI_491]
MAVAEKVIRVVVLNCGYTCPAIEKERGQYDEIFSSLLEAALERAISRDPTPMKWRLSIRGYDVVKEMYPHTVDDIDALIISGSPNGAYQDLPWIKALCHYIEYIYREQSSIKLYGSCFGHQVICQALFSSRGAIVEKSPTGWELGVHAIEISDEFLGEFSSLIPSKSLRLQFLHGDHVVFPRGTLPGSIRLIGSTTHCPVQGIYQPGRILTYQGHPEFDQFINTECLKLVGGRVGWDLAFTESAIAAASVSDDAAIAADVLMAFLLDITAQSEYNAKEIA